MAYGPNHCSLHGRTVLIEYRCKRCGVTALEPFEKQNKQAQGNLQFYKPPEGWLDDTGGVPFLMCPDCGKKFVRFCKNLPLEDQE